ncbi:hypothetical protein HJG60_008943 [Phyllostomus discolor]|uniref:Uncharacterized protein n=1 Tax=Phyllostomus discolor TaxID=89673 RepID=A0A834DLB6_9CHIR|nr:hypothetical protein HJG60_008943 [Phyllostomus discolor]
MEEEGSNCSPRERGRKREKHQCEKGIDWVTPTHTQRSAPGLGVLRLLTEGRTMCPRLDQGLTHNPEQKELGFFETVDVKYHPAGENAPSVPVTKAPVPGVREHRRLRRGVGAARAAGQGGLATRWDAPSQRFCGRPGKFPAACAVAPAAPQRPLPGKSKGCCRERKDRSLAWTPPGSGV